MYRQAVSSKKNYLQKRQHIHTNCLQMYSWQTKLQNIY